MTASTSHRMCPACLGTFKTIRSGVMVRHGFGARFPHGRLHGGFHFGGCQGTSRLPIGTVPGNAYALDIAVQQEARADTLAAMPAHTPDEVLAAMIRDAQDSIFRHHRNGGFPTAEQRAAYATPEAFAKTSVRGWFSDGALAHKARVMAKARADEIEGRRAHAVALRQAVANNPPPPAGGGDPEPQPEAPPPGAPRPMEGSLAAHRLKVARMAALREQADRLAATKERLIAIGCDYAEASSTWAALVDAVQSINAAMACMDRARASSLEEAA